MNLESSPSPLRAKLEKLARWGVMASALSGLLPAELVAQENLPHTTVAERVEKLELATLDAEIEQEVGHETVERLQGMRPRAMPAPERASAADIPIIGFEKKPKIARALRDELRRMPEAVVAAVKEIRYDSRRMALPARYGITQDNVEAAHTDPSYREIVFSAGSDIYGPILSAEALDHEACHMVSPEVDERLSPAERTRAYVDILRRVKAPDRFHSAYVESIASNDPQDRMKAKADEYWAETCGAFLRHDKLLPAADMKMVASVLDKLSSAR